MLNKIRLSSTNCTLMHPHASVLNPDRDCIKVTLQSHLWTPIVLQWASVTIGDSGTDFEKTSVNIYRFSNKALLSPFVSSFVHLCVL